MLRILITVLLCAVLATSEEDPTRVDPSVASQNLVKKIEPAIPPLAKAAGIGGTVTVEIGIDSQGKVKTVRLLSGHPMLAPSFIEAVKKWEYKPFLVNGQAIAVSTTVEWIVSTPKYSRAQERALQDYYPVFDNCYKLVKEGSGVQAEKRCSEAVALADKLPENRVLERSDARNFLGHSLFQQHRFAEAAPQYEKAVDIRRSYENSDRDADFASENANLARDYAALGQLDKADDSYSKAATIFEAAIVNLPSMKENYTSRLKQVLLEYANLKVARGSEDEASKLRDRAAHLK